MMSVSEMGSSSLLRGSLVAGLLSWSEEYLNGHAYSLSTGIGLLISGLRSFEQEI